MAHSTNSPDEAQTILSSDRAFSMCSSERPLTVQSSAPPTRSPTSTSVQYAVPGIAIPVTDSPVEAAPNTIEHVESSRKVVYSLDGSSSEDIELPEAQAMAARAMLRLAEARNKKKKPSPASARSGRSSDLLQIAQSSNTGHLPQNTIANRVTEIDQQPPQVELPVASTGRTVMNQSTSRPPAATEDPDRWWYPMWIPNAASAPERQVERPQGLDHENIQHVQTHEHADVDRLLDRPRDLDEASNRQKHHPTIHHDPVSADRDDRDEKIKMLMTRTAELEAPQPSSQGSGFMTPRENKRMVEDFFDRNSPPIDQTTETSHGHRHLPMVEPPPGLDGRVMDPTPIFTLMDFVFRMSRQMDGHPPPALPHQAPHRLRTTGARASAGARRRRRRTAIGRPAAGTTYTHAKLKNIADKMIVPKVKEPDTIKIKDFPRCTPSSHGRFTSAGSSTPLLEGMTTHSSGPWPSRMRPSHTRTSETSPPSHRSTRGLRMRSRRCRRATSERSSLRVARRLHVGSRGWLGGSSCGSSTTSTYAVDEEDGRLFELEVLMAPTFPGDAHMQQFFLTWQDYLNRMATDPGEVKRSIFHKLVKGSDASNFSLNAYDMAKRNSYKRWYDFPKPAASTHVQNKLRDNNHDALVKANLRNTNNRGGAMLGAVVSSDETPEQVTISAPAPKAKAKAKAQPCFEDQKGTCDRGDRCPYTHIGEPGSTPELSAGEKKNIAEKRSKIPCNANAAGRCRFGDKCQYMHSEFKTFAAGVCQDAPQGESEHDHSDIEIAFTAPASSPQMHDPRDDLQEVMSGSPTAPSSIVNRREVREWIIDTGTENHLVSRSRCVDDSDELFEVDRPLRLATANGEITADQRIHKNVNTIGTTLDPLLLEKTVDAISVGRLVLEKSFSFRWPSRGNAYLIDTHGNRTECETKGFVPVLKHKTDDDIYAFPCALPAVDEVERQDPAQQDDQAEGRRPTPLSTCCSTAPRTPTAGFVVFRR